MTVRNCNPWVKSQALWEMEHKHTAMPRGCLWIQFVQKAAEVFPWRAECSEWSVFPRYTLTLHLIFELHISCQNFLLSFELENQWIPSCSCCLFHVLCVLLSIHLFLVQRLYCLFSLLSLNWCYLILKLALAHSPIYQKPNQ